MQILRHLKPIIKSNSLYYSNLNTQNIIKEIVKKVDPFTSINITSAFNVRIRPFDLHECPDANMVRARIITNNQNLNDGHVNLDVKITDKIVDIVSEMKNTTGTEEMMTCLLEIPIKSNLNIESNGSIEISDMYSDIIKAIATKNLSTKNLQSSSICLATIDGNLNCNGTTLAQTLDIHTKNNGKISLHKLQGDLMHCKTEGGDIDVGSCYVEKSNFATETGNLNLRNIHKTAEVFVLNQGNIEMTGVNGNLYLKSNKGDLNIQFSEIVDDNIIVAEGSENCIINVSDIIEHDSFIEIHSDCVELDSSLSHLSDCLEESSKNHFILGKEENNHNKLRICTRGNLKFGKMSWADSVKIAMGIKDS